MPDINALLVAIQSHQWPVVVGLAILLIVYLARLPVVAAQWARIPAAYRPLVPVALGVLSGVAEALSTSQPWLPALIGGIVSALPALLAVLPSPVAHLDAPAPVVIPKAPPVPVIVESEEPK
jgi:hypothetical protein